MQMARKRDFPKRVAALRLAVERGDAEACSALGCLLEEGFTDRRGRQLVAPDLPGAVAAYRRAVELGDLGTLINLGYCYDTGRGVRRNVAQALRCYSRLWKVNRDGGAAGNIATVHRDHGDFGGAFRWMRKAATSGDDSAFPDLGYCLYYGIGVRRNTVRALAALICACESQNISEFDLEWAFYQRAVVHLDQGGEVNQSTAQALLIRANADDDYPEARALLRQMANGTDTIPCRCRRGLNRSVRGQVLCPVHKGLANRRLQPSARRAMKRRG
jgi:TPR repeat protein